MAHRLSRRACPSAHFRHHSGKDGERSRTPGRARPRRRMPGRRGAGHDGRTRAGKLRACLVRARPCALSGGQESRSASRRHAEHAVRFRPAPKLARRTLPLAVDSGGNRASFPHDGHGRRRSAHRGALRVFPAGSQGTAHRRRAERSAQLLLSFRSRSSAGAREARIHGRVRPLSGRRKERPQALRRAGIRRRKPSCARKGALP